MEWEWEWEASTCDADADVAMAMLCWQDGMGNRVGVRAKSERGCGFDALPKSGDKNSFQGGSPNKQVATPSPFLGLVG